MSSLVTIPAQTNQFKSSSSLQTRRHASSSVTIGQKGLSDPNEARYWTQKLGLGNANRYGAGKKQIAQPKTLTLPSTGPAAVHQVLFGPPLTTKKPPLAVVSGPRVSLYGTSSASSFFRSTSRHTSSLFGNKINPDRQVQTGGHVAHCAAFRNDGRLLAIGTDAGEVRVCDVTMRATLATFIGSTLPVRSLQWFRNGQCLLACGDDGIARIWNLASTDKKTAILELPGHGDVIRSTVLWQTNGAAKTEWNQLAITGSYDHTIRVWNLKDPDTESDEDRCISILNHGMPVEGLCLMQSGDPNVPVWLLSVGGTTIKVWNPISGRCFATVPTQHRKTITSVQAVLRSDLSEDTTTKTVSWRIVTASLDGLIQFHSWDAATGTLVHLYSTNIGYSISALTADETGDRLAIGSTTGEVTVKTKGPSVVSKKRTREPFAGTYSFFQRGMNAEAGTDDYTVSVQGKKPKLHNYDVAIRQFRYGDALDYALATRRPATVIAVLEQLGKRRALESSLSNRDEDSLEPILSFTTRYINRPHFARVLIGIAHKLIDIYGGTPGESEMVDELFTKLKIQVGNECNAQTSLLNLVGQVDSIIAASDYE